MKEEEEEGEGSGAESTEGRAQAGPASISRVLYRAPGPFPGD